MCYISVMGELLKIENVCEQDREWLQSQINSVFESDDFEYVDNCRLAMNDDPSEEAYDEARSEGCCGSFDTQWDGPSGATYL